jgi:thymidylate kinase
VRAGYRALAAREPARVVIVDATQGILDIEAEIRRHVETRLAAAEGRLALEPRIG